MAGNGTHAFDLFQMLNPVKHSATREMVERYKVEPYVVVADLYTADHIWGAAAGHGTRQRELVLPHGFRGIPGFTKREHARR